LGLSGGALQLGVSGGSRAAAVADAAQLRRIIRDIRRKVEGTALLRYRQHNDKT